MCILLFTTAHPKYPLILLSNRDEFLHRKTAPAAYWEPEYPHIFSGRDMARPEHGTWLGITKTGRLAALTNFRESSSAAAIGEKSRGAMITSFLTASPATSITDSATDSAAVDVAETSVADAESSATKFEAEFTGSEEFDADTDADTSFESDADTQSDTQPTTTAPRLHPAPSPSPDNLTTQSWIHSMLRSGEMKGVGGFSMLCGTLRPNGIGGLEPLAVISNRTEKRDEGVIEGTRWVCGNPGETRGLSNSLFDEPWNKVMVGEGLLKRVVEEDVAGAAGSQDCAADGDGGKDEDGEDARERLLEKCFQVLSTDTYPPITESSTYQSELDNLRESIFIPVFDVVKEGAPTPSPPEGYSSSPPKKHQMTEEELERWRQSPRLYGTAQQTVVLLDKRGYVTYVERTLYDSNAKPVEGRREVRTRFRIPGWA